MPFPTEIQNALRDYDYNKGIWRRLFRRDQAAIRALRKLNDTEQTNLLKIYQCFIENLPKVTQESHKVYLAVTHLNPTIPEMMNELYSAKLLKHINVDSLNHLDTHQFKNLASIVKRLSNAQLLTQQNLATIAPYYEAPEKLSIIASAVDKLAAGDRLKQINLDSIFEKPGSAVNIASTLILLHQSELLTDDNRSKLLDAANQFLLETKAYALVWRPLETYLPQLADVNERQSVFDHIIDLAQQENPAEKIETYLQELNDESDTPRSRSRTNTNDKFFTAPPLKTKSRTSLENLIDQSPSNRPGTL